MTATLYFPMSEYDRRIQKTRAEMARRGFDLLVVSDPSNMAWLTGYDGWSFYVHQAVLLGLEGEPVWWGRKMDGNGALRTCFMAPDNIAGYPDIYVQNPERHPMEHLAASHRRAPADAGSGRGRAGQLLVHGGSPCGAAARVSARPGSAMPPGS